MIEKQPFKAYQNKIMPYLDGTLSLEERAEFEAFISTHPEFKEELKSKESEIALLRNLIPGPDFVLRSYSNLQYEMRESVFNLLKEEPKNIWDTINSWLEDKFSR